LHNHFAFILLEFTSVLDAPKGVLVLISRIPFDPDWISRGRRVSRDPAIALERFNMAVHKHHIKRLQMTRQRRIVVVVRAGQRAGAINQIEFFL
jgi:hypothetical protein